MYSLLLPDYRHLYRNIERLHVLSTMLGSVVYLTENKQTSKTQTPSSTVTISKQLRNRKPAMLHTAQVNLSLKMLRERKLRSSTGSIAARDLG